MVVAFLIGLYLRSTLPYGRVPLHPDGIPRPIFYLIAVLLWVLVAFTTSLYDPRSSYKAADQFQTLVLTWGFFSLAVAGVLYFTFRDTPRLLVTYALVVLIRFSRACFACSAVNDDGAVAASHDLWR